MNNKKPAFIAQDIASQIDPKSGGHFTLSLIFTCGEAIGFSECRIAKSNSAWIISELEIVDAFRGRDYGTTLLEATRDALWSIDKFPICLKPGKPMGEALKASMNPTTHKGLNNQQLRKWYGRYGFQQVPGNLDYLCLKP